MNGPAIKFPDIAVLKKAMTQLVAGDMEKLPGDQRILICDRERLDPAQNITPNVGAPYDFPIGISLPSGAPVPLESLLKKLNSVLRNAHHAGFDWMSDAAIPGIPDKLVARRANEPYPDRAPQDCCVVRKRLEKQFHGGI